MTVLFFDKFDDNNLDLTKWKANSLTRFFEDWVGGNVTYVPLSGNIQTYINNAVAGDTLILASGNYVITSTITVNKQINILGQGRSGFYTIPSAAGSGTTISSVTTLPSGAFQISSSNVRINNLSINLTGAASLGVNTSANLSGISISNIDLIITCTGLAQGFVIYGSNAVLRDLTFYITSTNNGAIGLWIWNDSSVTQNSIVDCFNVTGTSSGFATYSYSFCAENINDANTLTLNLSNSVCKAIGGSVEDVAVASISTTTNNSIVNCYLCTLDGLDYDTLQTGSNQLNLGGSVLVNNLTSGTVTYRTTMAAGTIVAGGTLTVATGSITDSTGAISFVNENLVTTGTIGGGAITGTSFIIGANTLNTTEWAYLDGLDQALLTTSPVRHARGAYGMAVHATDILSILSADVVASGNVVNISHSGIINPGSHTILNIVGTAVCSVDQIGASINVSGASLNNKALVLSSSGATNNYAAYVSNGQIAVPLGTAGLPSICNSTDPTTGIFFNTSTGIGWTIQGTERFRILNSYFQLVAGWYFGFLSGEAGSAVDMSIYRRASGILTTTKAFEVTNQLAVGTTINTLNQFDLLQTSTTANSVGLNILHSGLVAGGASTVYGQRISVTGANGTNIGLDFSGGVTGATTNYLIYSGSTIFWKATGAFSTTGNISCYNLYQQTPGNTLGINGYVTDVDTKQGVWIGNVNTLTASIARYIVGFYRDNGSTRMSYINTFGQYETLDTSAAFYVRTAFTSSVALNANRVLTFDLLNADRTLKFGNAHIVDADAGTIVAQFNTLLSELETAGILLAT